MSGCVRRWESQFSAVQAVPFHWTFWWVFERGCHLKDKLLSVRGNWEAGPSRPEGFVYLVSPSLCAWEEEEGLSTVF